MAADQTAVNAATLTLTANTSQTIELTGPGQRIDLIHHGNVAASVYFKVGKTEAAVDTMAGGGADEERALTAADRRIRVNVPRTKGGSVWIGLRSTGAVTVSAELQPGGL